LRKWSRKNWKLSKDIQNSHFQEVFVKCKTINIQILCFSLTNSDQISKKILIKYREISTSFIEFLRTKNLKIITSPKFSISFFFVEIFMHLFWFVPKIFVYFPNVLFQNIWFQNKTLVVEIQRLKAIYYKRIFMMLFLKWRKVFWWLTWKVFFINHTMMDN